MYRTHNPATGILEAEYPVLSVEEISAAAQRSADRYPQWAAVELSQRAAAIEKAAQLFEERREELARIITTEMGKPISQSLGELALVASICRYYAQNAQQLLEDEVLSPASSDQAVIRTTPIGPVLGIMPWNYPFYQVARFAIPNLLLGNTVLLKHASNCPQSAIAFEKVLHDAGIHPDAYINLLASSADLQQLIASKHIQGISLTGSEPAGQAVAAAAGGQLKKVVLELGGSDPLLVLDSHNLARTVKQALLGRFLNAGQACVASKRIIVLDEVFDQFAGEFSAAVSELAPGDPLDPKTFLGPLSSAAARDEIMRIVDQALSQGATALVAPAARELGDAYLSPIVLSGVTENMRAFHEELFGPVAVLYRARDVEHAIALANGSPFGLGAAVFGADREQAAAVADRLEAGMVVINGIAGSQADLPFGGIKRSGIGRELGRWGLDEFSNKKLIRTPAAAK